MKNLFLYCLIYFFDHLKDYNMYIFLLPATFFLFCLASNLNLKDRPLYTKLRSLSLLIYFLHMLAWRVVLIGNTAIDKFLGIDISDFIFIETMILVIAASVLIEYLSHKRGFGWLKYLYS